MCNNKTQIHFLSAFMQVCLQFKDEFPARMKGLTDNVDEKIPKHPFVRNLRWAKTGVVFFLSRNTEVIKCRRHTARI